MNSLLFATETNKFRLTWSSAVLDDGTGAPDSYEIWRRPVGSNSALIIKIGSTSGVTFLDVTAVIPED